MFNVKGGACKQIFHDHVLLLYPWFDSVCGGAIPGEGFGPKQTVTL